MVVEAEREYHVRRARQELDLAYRAEGHAAMAAHLRLSALHMARLQPLATEPFGVRLEHVRAMSRQFA